jgi:uncharacterized protein (DUF362 family)
MRSVPNSGLTNPYVALVEASSGYADWDPADERAMVMALDRAAALLGWCSDVRGSLGNIISPGDKVVVKPNLVLHANQGTGGIEPLVTHPSCIKAVVKAALDAGAGEVIVGDAPIQSCDLERLLDSVELAQWSKEMIGQDPRFKGIRDFRRTTCTSTRGVRIASENRQSEDRFVLFDLGLESLLEPITRTQPSFRVTCYDPRLMARTHGPGRHRYLVAKDIIEADVVINLPKLKTHKKAGITCALKNLVGINGNKEYLPHHRVGGSDTGGDCYAGRSVVKRTLEHIADLQNSVTSYGLGLFLRSLTIPLYQLLKIEKDRTGIEGSWSGNDTIWRTCLDLNRILLYGRTDSTLSETVQRKVIHVVDAVIAGQGDGPLAPDPLPLGLILAGNSGAAVDYVGAHLLGYDPERIRLIQRVFASGRRPIAPFIPSDITLVGDWGMGPACEILPGRRTHTRVSHPIGWKDASVGDGEDILSGSLQPASFSSSQEVKERAG